MGFKCGIVGLPNVGKSTLFNCLTKAGIDAANYPFCTIEPNVGVVTVPDHRLDAIAQIVNPQRILPTTIEFVDIAGLVKGASKGEGLGNQFLANIRETDAIAHVVRCFHNENVIHVSEKVSPIDDIETINTELALADLETTQRALQKLNSQMKSGADKKLTAYKDLLEKIRERLDEGKSVRSLSLSPDEKLLIKPLHLLTEKPVMYIANVDEEGLQGNDLLKSVQDYAKNDLAEVVTICASLEAELVELDDEEKQTFLAEYHLDEPGLNRVIRAGYKLLNLETFFTAGEKEVRAWTIYIGALAPQAAGCIHTDFEKGFIRAEVIAYDDFIQFRGEQAAKEAGKLRVEGKDYIVKDGDIMHFRFNV